MPAPFFSVKGIGSSNLRRELAMEAPAPAHITGAAAGLAAELIAAYTALRYLLIRKSPRMIREAAENQE